MKVKNLINELKKLPPHLEVAVEADLGQTPMHATWCGVYYVADKSEYMMEGIAEEDLKEYPNAEKIVVIQGN